MKKLLNAALGYGLAGVLAGAAYQILEKTWCWAAYTPLAGLHAHLLTMGMLLFLALLALEKPLRLTCDHAYRAFFITYNVGLAGAAAAAVLHSLEYVWPFPCPLSWLLFCLAVAFHLVAAVGLGLLYGILRRRIRACGCPHR